MAIWGIHAPAKLKERTKWLEELGEEIGKDEGCEIVAGCFNFVLDPNLDKRGGRINSGTVGSIEQNNGEKTLESQTFGENNISKR